MKIKNIELNCFRVLFRLFLSGSFKVLVLTIIKQKVQLYINKMFYHKYRRNSQAQIDLNIYHFEPSRKIWISKRRTFGPFEMFDNEI